MLRNNKGFTIIEFVLSFTLAMFIVLGIYSLTLNYREKTQLQESKKTLIEYKNDITEAIYEDIQDKGIKSIDSCVDDTNTIIDKCIVLTFKNNTSKRLRIVTTTEEETLGTSTFTYDVDSIVYGKNLFTVPDPKYVNVIDDYMFLDSSQISTDIKNMYDMNDDGVIEESDFLRYQECYEDASGSKGVCTTREYNKLDLNFDGRVDKTDLRVYEAYNQGFDGQYGDYGKIYSIKIRLKHQNIKGEIVIKVVASTN